MAETTAPRTGDRRKLAVAVTAGVAALAALVWIITGQTVAGFTAETRNADNTFQAGTIEISDDQNGVRLFDFQNMLPGQDKVEDIVVSNADNAPLDVKLFTSDIAELALNETTGEWEPTDSGLAENLLVTISLVGADDALTTVFDGTLAELVGKSDWATGASNQADGDDLAASPDPANPSTLTYRFTVKLSEFAGLDEEDVNPNERATATFIWEGRA